MHDEINFWYKHEFHRFRHVDDVTYVKDVNMLIIREGENGLYNVSHWDVRQIYNLNVINYDE